MIPLLGCCYHQFAAQRPASLVSRKTPFRQAAELCLRSRGEHFHPRKCTRMHAHVAVKRAHTSIRRNYRLANVRDRRGSRWPVSRSPYPAPRCCGNNVRHTCNCPAKLSSRDESLFNARRNVMRAITVRTDDN